MADTTTNYDDLIGRSELDDLEAILSVTNSERDEVLHAVQSNYQTIFTWDYSKGSRPKLDKLYEKAKRSQWNAQTDMPWDVEVDQEKLVVNNALAQGGFNAGMDVTGTPFEKWTDKEWVQLGIEM